MNLEENRRKQNEIERNQNILISNYIEQRMKNFDYAEISLWTLENQKESDLIFISEKVNDWHNKAKNENKKQFLDILLAIFRVQSYCTNMETISKASVANYSMECKRTKDLENEIFNLKLEFNNYKKQKESEIEKLQKEIEFINSGSK